MAIDWQFASSTAAAIAAFAALANVRQSRRNWQTANSPYLFAEVARLGEFAQLRIVNAGPGAKVSRSALALASY